MRCARVQGRSAARNGSSDCIHSSQNRSDSTGSRPSSMSRAIPRLRASTRSDCTQITRSACSASDARPAPTPSTISVIADAGTTTAPGRPCAIQPGGRKHTGLPARQGAMTPRTSSSSHSIGCRCQDTSSVCTTVPTSSAASDCESVVFPPALRPSTRMSNRSPEPDSRFTNSRNSLSDNRFQEETAGSSGCSLTTCQS